MVDQERLQAAFGKIRERMLKSDGTPVLPDWTRQIVFHFPDVAQYWLLEVVNGQPQALTMVEEAPETEVQITMSSDTFVKLMDKTLSGFVAMTRGLVKVKASMGDMRRMQVFM